MGRAADCFDCLDVVSSPTSTNKSGQPLSPRSETGQADSKPSVELLCFKGSNKSRRMVNTNVRVQGRCSKKHEGLCFARLVVKVHT